jgi:hypothetical protein
MTETGIWRASRSIGVGDGASTAGSNSRLTVRLWMLLHAQALLQGTIGGAGGASYVEDDRRRLAAHRGGLHRP